VIFNSYVKLTEGTLIFVLGCGPACHYDWFSTADHDDFFLFLVRSSIIGKFATLVL
jgi:hypothetical protein